MAGKVPPNPGHGNDAHEGVCANDPDHGPPALGRVDDHE